MLIILERINDGKGRLVDGFLGAYLCCTVGGLGIGIAKVSVHAHRYYPRLRSS